MVYRVIPLAFWIGLNAHAVQNRDCEGLLVPSSLTALVEHIKQQPARSFQSYKLQAWSNEYSEQEYFDVRTLIRSTYGVQMELTNIDTSGSWVVLDFHIQGQADLLVLLIEEILDHQEHLYWMRKP